MARPSASTARKCAHATSPCCSPTPRPARVRRLWCIRAASARSSRRAPTSAGACWKKPPALPDCMRAATRRSCGSRPPSKHLARVEDVIGQLAAQVASAQDASAASSALPQHFRTGAQHRSAAVSSALDRRRKPKSPRPSASRTKRSASSRRRTGEQLQPRRVRPKSPPPCRACAKPKPKPPPRCSGSLIARETLEREEARAKERIGELDRRLAQFAADLERERALAADAEAALARLDAEETALKAAAQANAARLAGVNQRVAAANAALSLSEKIFCRIDRRARRSDRAAQPATGGVAPSTSSARRGLRPKSPISTPGLPRPMPALPILRHWRRRLRPRSPRSPKPRQAAHAAEAAHKHSARSNRRRPRAARRRRARRAAARDRSQDHRQASCRREQKSVAAGDGRAHGERGL